MKETNELSTAAFLLPSLSLFLSISHFSLLFVSLTTTYYLSLSFSSFTHHRFPMVRERNELISWEIKSMDHTDNTQVSTLIYSCRRSLTHSCSSLLFVIYDSICFSLFIFLLSTYKLFFNTLITTTIIISQSSHRSHAMILTYTCGLSEMIRINFLLQENDRKIKKIAVILQQWNKLLWVKRVFLPDAIIHNTIWIESFLCVSVCEFFFGRR